MDKLAKWHQTKIGMAVFGAIELAIAYIFVSLAIDRGSWWWYALALVFLFGGLRNYAKLVGRFFNDKAGRTR
jgi:hypothetical protein